jgi:hypothetical protein
LDQGLIDRVEIQVSHGFEKVRCPSSIRASGPPMAADSLSGSNPASSAAIALSWNGRSNHPLAVLAFDAAVLEEATLST